MTSARSPKTSRDSTALSWTGLSAATLGPDDAAGLSLLIERASRLLTSHNLILQNLVQRPGEQLGPLLGVLGRCAGAATARMTIQCLVAAAEQDPGGVARVVVMMIEQP